MFCLYVYIYIRIKWIVTVTMYLVKFIPSLLKIGVLDQLKISIHGASGEVCRIWSSNGTSQGAMGLRMFDDNHYMTNYYRMKLWMCGIHFR